jgi:protein-tyrosine-phosphatase
MAVELEYWPSLDPTGIDDSREVVMAAYRQVRDQLLQRIKVRFGEE